MTSQRLLVISHGHPAIKPGGGENAAYALHQAVLALPQCRSVFWLQRHQAQSKLAVRFHGLMPKGMSG